MDSSVGLCIMLLEYPVTLYGGSIESVCLLFKSSGQGNEETNYLIHVILDRLLTI
jgi:hypothetical protein